MVLMGATSGLFLPSVLQCGAQDLKYYVWLMLAPLTEESKPAEFPCLEVFLSSLWVILFCMQRVFSPGL